MSRYLQHQRTTFVADRELAVLHLADPRAVAIASELRQHSDLVKEQYETQGGQVIAVHRRYPFVVRARCFEPQTVRVVLCGVPARDARTPIWGGGDVIPLRISFRDR